MSSNVIVIQLGNKKNQQFYFPPLQENLRGDWVFDNLPRGTTSGRGLQSIPDTPGLQIVLDVEGKTAKLLDPLLFPENASLYDELKNKHEAVFGKTRAWPDRLLTLRDANDVKTWWYWIKRFVDGGSAKLISGNLAISLPGKPRKTCGAMNIYEQEEEATTNNSSAVSQGKRG